MYQIPECQILSLYQNHQEGQESATLPVPENADIFHPSPQKGPHAPPRNALHFVQIYFFHNSPRDTLFWYNQQVSSDKINIYHKEFWKKMAQNNIFCTFLSFSSKKIWTVRKNIYLCNPKRNGALLKSPNPRETRDWFASSAGRAQHF